MSEIVEHWWNGQWGMARLDIQFERDGGRWQVRASADRGRRQELVYPCRTERQARRYVEHLLRTAAAPKGGWEWRDIAAAHRRYE